MIIRRGDLFSTTDHVIAHGCNNQGVMGAGVAKIIRDRFPKAYADYVDALYDLAERQLPALPLGWNNYSRQPQGNVFLVVNMITQTLAKVERPVSYDAIDDCFADLFQYMKTHGYTGVSIPKIGAGLGGGDWAVIEAIIRGQESKVSGITVTVWEL